jgi:hypothetical protein
MGYKFRNIIPKIGIALFVILFVLEMVVLGYSATFYKADEKAIRVSHMKNVSCEGSYYLLKPDEDEDTHQGIIFYPGGKVEVRGYLPMAEKMAERGYTVALCRMPINLAFFDMNAYKAPVANVKGVDEWYMMGHSLGGVAAGTCFNNHLSDFEGLILLGSYPLKSKEPENTLVIYGTQDLNMKTEMIHPKNEVLKLEGGNHAQFGNYGIQAGDGKATLSREMQQNLAADRIVDFINRGK